MSTARDPDEVLASIRRLVAREVSDAKDREAQERPVKDSVPVLSSKASQAARLVLGEDEAIAANGLPSETRSPGAYQPPQPHTTGAAGIPNADKPTTASAPETAPEPVSAPAHSEDDLRDMIRDIIREEVRNNIGPRINANIRRIVQEELAQLFSEGPQ